jgi:hypothetical protein
MAYKTLTQMTTNMLDPVRGWWDERQLSRVCPVSGYDPTSSSTFVVAGSVGYLNSNNEFVKATTGHTNKMPLFARGGTEDNDHQRVIGNMSGQRATSTQGTPAQSGASTTAFKEVGISCLVGTGPYELGTTEYTGSVTSGGLLMASTATAGKIAAFGASTTNSFYVNSTGGVGTNTNQVIGIATSSAGVKNQYGVGMLYFYVNWWPAI